MTGSVYMNDHARMYQRGGSKKQDSGQLWLHEQRLPYPHHLRHTELIEAYEQAQEKHLQAIKTVQVVVKHRQGLPDNLRDEKELQRCQERVVQTREAVERAEAELRRFNQHQPAERIALYQSEVIALEAQLATARAEENSFTEELLHNPDANRLKLERLVHGYKGIEAEYSAEELSKLRTLRNRVESLRSQIQRHRWDIQRIEELAAEAQKRERLQAEMDALLPRFGKAAAKFTEALSELESAAREHGILCDVRGVKIPVGAKLRLSSGPYDGTSTILLQWE